MKENDKQREESQNTKKGWHKLSSKRWVYPAIYIAAVALILTGVLWMQASNNHKGHQAAKTPTNNQSIAMHLKTNNQEAVPANSVAEVFKMPVADQSSVDIEKQYYDVNGSAKDQQAALVYYDNTYYQNTGIDIQAKNGKTFAVTASMSGTVEKATQDPTLGYEVVLKHKNGVETYYQSLSSLAVKAGDKVSQGDILGEAGTCAYDKDAGTHLHFEIRKDGLPVNPVAYFQKGISSLDNIMKTSSKAKDNSKSNNTKSNDKSNKTPNNNAPSKKAPNNSNNNSSNGNNTNAG